MVLHIFHAHSLFTDLAKKCFSEAGIKSYFLILEDESGNAPLTKDTVYMKIGSEKYAAFLHNELNTFKLIIFHGLLKANLKCIREITKMKALKPEVSWVIYGAEIQDSLINPSYFLGLKTAMAYYFLRPYRLAFPLLRVINRLRGYDLKSSISKVNYFAHFIPQELDFVAKHTGVRQPMLWHSYAMIENFIEPSVMHSEINKEGNIFIGNSASFTSNHLEIFHKLKKMNVGDRKIVVPLSYGNSQYAKYICRKGKQLFFNQFVGLRVFMDKEEYHKILLNCSVMILNHNRQQALGNIVSAAWLGMRIYIREEISTYKFFKELGLHVYSIEKHLISSDPDVFSALSQQQVLHNRSVLTKLFSKEHAIQKIRDSYMQFSEQKNV